MYTHYHVQLTPPPQTNTVAATTDAAASATFARSAVRSLRTLGRVRSRLVFGAYGPEGFEFGGSG